MNLIDFQQYGVEWRGTAAGYRVATVTETPKGYQITECLGVKDPLPPFRYACEAHHACQAYFLKFLFDLGFTPTERVSLAPR